MREKRVEAVQKRRRIREAATAEGAELEDQERGLIAVGQERAQEHLLKGVGVQKALVVAAGLRAIAGVNGKDLARDLLGNFEGEAEALRRPREELLPEVLGGELIEREVSAHRGEDLRVLTQALGLELFFGEAAAGEIALPAINLSEPPLILPGAAADIDIVGGQVTEAIRQVVAGKRIGIFEERTYHACAARK
jgi:hypothetical protein